MKTADDDPRLADDPMSRHDVSAEGFGREARQLAKERQDRVHAALDGWIAAAIAELAAPR